MPWLDERKTALLQRYLLQADGDADFCGLSSALLLLLALISAASIFLSTVMTCSTWKEMPADLIHSIQSNLILIRLTHPAHPGTELNPLTYPT